MTWLILPDGYTSMVVFSAAKDPAMAERHGATDPDGDYVLVRARDEAQLHVFADRYGLIVDSDTAADYRWRTVATRAQYKDYACWQIDEMTATSHAKEFMMDRPVNKGWKGWSLALYSIWDTLADLQPTKPYATKVWPRKGWDWPQTGKHSAAEAASTFTEVFGWDDLLEPGAVQLELPRGDASDAFTYSYTDRLGDDLDDPWLWDPELSNLTDDELAELEEFDNWQRANDQIVRENNAGAGCASDAVAGTVATATPTTKKQRRRDRRRRNQQKGK